MHDTARQCGAAQCGAHHAPARALQAVVAMDGTVKRSDGSDDEPIPPPATFKIAAGLRAHSSAQLGLSSSSQINFAAWSMRRTLLTPQVNPGSHYHCGNII